MIDEGSKSASQQGRSGVLCLYPDIAPRYLALTKELSQMGILDARLLDHSAMGAPAVPADLKLQLRAAFHGLFILAGGFDQTAAESVLRAGERGRALRAAHARLLHINRRFDSFLDRGRVTRIVTDGRLTTRLTFTGRFSLP